MAQILTLQSEGHNRIEGNSGMGPWDIQLHTMDIRGWYENEPLIEIRVAEQYGEAVWIGLDQTEIEQLRSALQIVGEIAKEAP